MGFSAIFLLILLGTAIFFNVVVLVSKPTPSTFIAFVLHVLAIAAVLDITNVI